MDENATAVDALAQINNIPLPPSKGENNIPLPPSKGEAYLISYTADNRRLIKIGVTFSIKSKGVKDWIIDFSQ